MIDWSFSPEVQALYDKVTAANARLQRELGITPMTLAERAEAYERNKAENMRRQEELRQLQERISKSRPLPKWKV